MPHPEVLGLDPERLLRLSDAYAGYANALDDARPELRPWAASSQMLAAVYRLLVDPPQARTAFARAARAYAEQDAPLAMVLAICAGEDELLRSLTRPSFEQNGSTAGPLEILGRTLTQVWLTETETPPGELDARGAGGGLERFAFSPAGRLGVPVAAYVRAFGDIQRAAEDREADQSRYRGGTGRWDERSRALPAFAMFLERASEPILAAMSDRYHWYRAHSAVLPVEPEAVAACRCVLRIWTRRGRGVHELFSLVAADQVDPVAVMPLELAADLEEEERVR